ncbi:DHA1 family bicyclomycin/chloramphenicol resistance-like MFS transporter [Alicyclobacillus cycloheptanicus]|uniref:Bcr/CflA family efflux transporter n=2 Tax=Alicyclobacillus cycloheptanicus TaxID=1457 RepID=A0ABT9XNR7_9BACL|nr:DHA1 family bicyclomycin/chloramphenicol resistance-like MFS transporter [Alicyclobacillus cycloheptanicus]
MANTEPMHTGRLGKAVLLGSLTAFGPLSIDMYLPSLPSLTKDLHTTASMAQLSLTCCLLGLALGQLLAGPLSDARGRRTPLLAGVGVYAIASLLCAFTPSIWPLVVLRFIQGLAGAFGIVIARAVARDLYSGSELTRFYSLLMLVNGVAPILAPVVGGQLLRFTSWHGVFVVLTILGALMLTASALYLKESLPAERRVQGGIPKTLRNFRGLLSDRRFVGFAGSQGLVFAAMFSYISGSPFVIQNIFGLSAQAFSVIFAVNGVGIIIASQLAGRLSGRVGELRILMTGLLIACVFGLALLVVVLTGPNLTAVVICLFFVVASVGLVSTTATSLAMQSQGQAAGSASGLLGVAQMFAGGVAAPLVGLGGSYDAVPMGIVIAVCEAGAILSYGLAARTHNRTPYDEQPLSM